jgi:hypothetical protein
MVKLKFEANFSTAVCINLEILLRNLVWVAAFFPGVFAAKQHEEM